jgi:cytochrome c
MKKSDIIISTITIIFIVISFASFAQTEQNIKNDKNSVTSVSIGEQLVEKYGCLACHKIYGPKVGPAYHGISIKYRKEVGEKAADSIAYYIKNGSQGKYPCHMVENAVMPPFDIPKDERMAIANWIVSLRPMKDMYKKNEEEDK